MELQYKLDEAKGYLTARFTGEWHLDAVKHLIDALVEDCRTRNRDKLLADCIDVWVSGRILEFERFVIGSYIGARLRRIKVAALFPDQQINKLAETIAIEGGADFLVTSDLDEAVRWLTADPPDAVSAVC